MSQLNDFSLIYMQFNGTKTTACKVIVNNLNVDWSFMKQFITGVKLPHCDFFTSGISNLN